MNHLPFAATEMDLYIISKVSQEEKGKYHMVLLICGILKKNDRDELIYKIEIDTDIENQLMVTKGEKVGRINQELWTKRDTLLYVKQINNKALLYSKGNYIQYHIINHNGTESE